MSSARKRSAIAKANNRADHAEQLAILNGHHRDVFHSFAKAAAMKLKQRRTDFLIIVAEELEQLLLIHGERMNNEVRDAVVAAFEGIKRRTQAEIIEVKGQTT